MAPAWQQLGETFNAESSSVLIADVDCTADGESLCEEFGVGGYPTIKYFVDGDVSVGQDYQGGRDFDSLETFVRETLEVKCNVADPKDCSDKEKKYMDKMKDKSSQDRKFQIDRLSKMKGDPMKADLKQWLVQRLRILTALEAADQEL